MKVFSVVDANDYEGFGPPSIFAHLCDALDEAERANQRADWAEVRVHTDEDPRGVELDWFGRIGPVPRGTVNWQVPRVTFGTCGSIGLPPTGLL